MSIENFHIATSNELIAIKDRVRYLINHWGEDGKYKEAILKNIIKRFLPTGLEIATGFVIAQHCVEDKHKSSTQIDLIIYDATFPVFFKEGDFVVVTPDSVKAIIEVKTDLKKFGFEKTYKKANENGKFIINNKKECGSHFFNGIFSYQGYEKFRWEEIKNKIIKEDDAFFGDNNFSLFKVNHINFNKDYSYIYHSVKNIFLNSVEWYNVFNQSDDIAISMFISNLMYYISNNREISTNNLIWFPQHRNMTIKGKFEYKFTDNKVEII